MCIQSDQTGKKTTNKKAQSKVHWLNWTKLMSSMHTYRILWKIHQKNWQNLHQNSTRHTHPNYKIETNSHITESQIKRHIYCITCKVRSSNKLPNPTIIQQSEYYNLIWLHNPIGHQNNSQSRQVPLFFKPAKCWATI